VPAILPKLQADIVTWAINAFEELQGTVGYITVDFVGSNVYGSESPYERTIGLSYPWAAKEFTAKSRGYYWGNLLSQTHVDILGGLEKVKEAPVEIIQTLRNGGVYLQLNHDINHINLDQLRQLKTFLSPLLPTGDPLEKQSYDALPNFIL
jgi:hypothetical protein